MLSIEGGGGWRRKKKPYDWAVCKPGGHLSNRQGSPACSGQCHSWAGSPGSVNRFSKLTRASNRYPPWPLPPDPFPVGFLSFDNKAVEVYRTNPIIQVGHGVSLQNSKFLTVIGSVDLKTQLLLVC